MINIFVAIAVILSLGSIYVLVYAKAVKNKLTIGLIGPTLLYLCFLNFGQILVSQASNGLDILFLIVTISLSGNVTSKVIVSMKKELNLDLSSSELYDYSITDQSSSELRKIVIVTIFFILAVSSIIMAM